MKKLFTFLIVLFLWAGSSWGQSAIIGTGTGTTNGSIIDPVDRYYNYTHYQVVYTAAELAAAGMPSGAVITALGFSISESAVSLGNFTVDMGLTTQALANPYISAGLINVKTSFTYAPVVQAAGSFDMITFDTPFTWDGTSNIVVSTCTGSNPYTSPYGGLRYTAATSGAIRYVRTDGSSNCATATGTNSTYKPNIRFDYTAGSACSGTPAPGNTLSSANPTCSGVSFTLSLQNATLGSGVTYQWQSSPDGSSWANVGTSSSTFITSQTAATYYQCLVTCSGSTTASTPVYVTMNAFLNCYCASGAASTGDEDITKVKFGSSLDNTSACASLTGTQGTATGTADLYSNFTSITPSDISQGVLTPIEVEVTECAGDPYGHDVRVYFDFNQNGSLADAGEEFIIWAYVSSNTHTITANILVPVTATLGNTLMRVVCKESATTGPCLVSSWGETEDYIVNITLAPPCLPVINLAAGSLTYNSANISWTAQGSETGWEYVYGPAPLAVPVGAGIPTASSTTNLLSSLSASTAYQFYVRPMCSPDPGDWSGPASFTTPAQFSTTLTAVSSAYVSNLDKTINPGLMHVSALVAASTASDTAGRAAMKFDLSGIPSNAIITSATVNYYQVWNVLSSAANNLYPLANDPATATGANLWTDCGDGLSMWSGAWPLTSPGWYNNTLNANGIAYLTDQLLLGWAGVAIVRGSTNQYNFAGFNHPTYPPTITIGYNIPTTPIFSVTPSSFDFEQVNLGIQSLPKTFTIKNTGVGTLTVKSVNLSGADASQFVKTDANAYPVDLGAGASITLQVLFKPTSTGAKTASLDIEEESMHYVALSGIGYLNGPQNLTATNDLANVNLAWEAPLPLEEIKYDDNTAETSYWVGTPSTTSQYFYTKITIPVDGTLNSFAVATLGGATASTWESLSLCPESGGLPNLAAPIQSYASVPVAANFFGFKVLNLSAPLAVTAGQNYYVVTQWPAASTDGPYVPTDTHNDHQRCAWTSDGIAWNAIAMNFIMRAYMTPSGAKAASGPITLVSGDPTAGFELLPRNSVQYVHEETEIQAPLHVMAPVVTSASPVKSFTNYTVHRGTATGVYTTTFSGIGGTTYTDVTALPSTLYYYMVSAEYSNGSASSNEVSITTLASCPVPTAGIASVITASSANLGWTENGLATTWEYVYGVSPLSPPSGSGTATNVNPTPISGLSASTTYQFYVRASCGVDFSAWAGPFTFTTPCDAAALPWSENFDLVTTPALPSCWFKENGDWITTTNSNSTYDADAHSGTQFLRESWSATNEYVWTPGFALTAGTSYDFSFWWAGDTYSGWTGDVFYNTGQTSVGATQLGTSFVTDATTTTFSYAQVVNTFIAPSTGIYYFAIRANCPTSAPWYLSFDDFSMVVTPSTKTVNLKAYIEGYWNGATMNQVQDADIDYNVFNKFTGTTVDTLAVLLAEENSPWSYLIEVHDVNINPDGTMSITIPASFSGNYFIVIKQRNTVETWSANAVNFSAGTISYDFTTSADQAYGSNQKDLLGDGSVWGLYSGDFTSSTTGVKDEYVDFFDLNEIFNLNLNSAFGFQTADITGDGFVDFFDVNMAYNNNLNSVGMNTPVNPAKKRPNTGGMNSNH